MERGFNHADLRIRLRGLQGAAREDRDVEWRAGDVPEMRKPQADRAIFGVRGPRRKWFERVREFVVSLNVRRRVRLYSENVRLPLAQTARCAKGCRPILGVPFHRSAVRSNYREYFFTFSGSGTPAGSLGSGTGSPGVSRSGNTPAQIGSA